ncbi:hypothetical protein L1987_61615 [Smallanthus sonchifolius]|uniref:Uncharacterized protein n=1 Tax=Smallanthus sonchifolius TaxID=185202 RepID=A0ACB9C8A6_9ASTR|nr:hypothetical protein L1987_61615 [Smallanthus sonchifolius]
MERYRLRKKKEGIHRKNHEFDRIVLSWSLDDILNEELYKHQRQSRTRIEELASAAKTYLQDILQIRSLL